MITYRRGTAADWPKLAVLLTAAQLPLQGAEAHLSSFLLGFHGEEIVGSAGLEVYGATALLRSVAVRATERGTGLGQELVRRLLDQAHTDGIKQVVLLTTTAERFFPRFGFEQVTRDQVDAAALASPEFQGACPASATIMQVDLNRLLDAT